MTNFKRRGHFRTSVYGHQFWVGEHNVDRTSWDHVGGSGPRSASFFRLDLLGALKGVTAAFVNPNAVCPVCGDSVFYYQNEHGSRVFFDELGPPWPKHPCTDSEVTRSKKRYLKMSIRDEEDVADIFAQRGLERIDAAREFRERFGIRPPSLYVVAKRLRGKRKSLLILEKLDSSSRRYAYYELYLRKGRLAQGDLVAIRNGKLSFFNTRKMREQTCAITRILSAKSFVKALVESEDVG